jgi:hypothetical protein
VTVFRQAKMAMENGWRDTRLSVGKRSERQR